MYQEALSAVAVGLTLIAYLPYIHLILKEEIKPHFFSWII